MWFRPNVGDGGGCALVCLLLCSRKITVENSEGTLWTLIGLGHRVHLTAETSRQRKKNASH